MRCTFCNGTGRQWGINKDGRYGPLWPRTFQCPDCGGTGILHCREGEQAQAPERPLTSSEQRILDGALRRSVKIVENGNEPD